MLKQIKKAVFKRGFTSRQDLQGRYPQYEIGRGSYGKPQILDWGEGATLKLGAFCSIADGVKIFLGGEHRTDWVTTYPFSVLWKSARQQNGHPRSKGDVIIGNDVWIGEEAIILSGVRIGDGAVVGARAVVSKDIPPYAVVVGNPARVIKRRFEDEIVAQLLSIQWWLWDDERIEKAIPFLLDDNIEAFLTAATANEI